MAPPVLASQVSTTVGVSVRVVGNAILRSEFQARELSISQADVDRGYVDATGASRFSVSTNGRSGYQLVFHCVVDLFDTMQVGGLRTPAHLGAEGGIIVQRGVPPPGVRQELNYRFFLSSRTKPGDYPWPLALSARALE
jgi:hypothetical protein